MTLDEIKLKARNENNNNLYIAVEMLCDYIKDLELLINKPKVVKPNKEITKKGTK